MIGILLGSAVWFGMHRAKSEEHIDPETKEGRHRLVTLSRNGQHIVDAIRKYRRDHGSFPEKLDGLAVGDNAVTEMISQSTYSSKNGPCGLTYKISSDASLKYFCEEQPFKRRYWKFIPGGSAAGSEIMIDKSDR